MFWEMLAVDIRFLKDNFGPPEACCLRRSAMNVSLNSTLLQSMRLLCKVWDVCRDGVQ